MSATGRGERGGGGLDFFPTPPEAVRALLEACPLPGGRWMEPGAGDGAIIRAVDDWRDLQRLPPVWWRAVEVNPAHRRALERSLFRSAGELLIEDFFARPQGQWDCIIGNPAFHLSERYLSVCLPLAPVVCFLEKLTFLGAQRRADFWRAHPADVYVLSERPFPDMTEYAWFVWGQCGTGPGRIRVLGPDDSQLPLLSASPG